MVRRLFFEFFKILCLFFVASFVNADLVIKNGETFTLNSITSEILIINNNLAIEKSGTLQGANNTEIRLSGDWVNAAGGNYIHGNSKVFFNGSSISKVKGNNHFYHLVVDKKNTVNDHKYTGSEIQIESGSVQTIISQLILNGASIDDRLKIRSTTDGLSHTIDTSGAAYVEAWYLDVDDSIFLGSIDMPMNINGSSVVGPIVGSGNNEGWIPNVAPTITINVNNFTEDQVVLFAGVSPAGSYELFDANDDPLSLGFTTGTNINGHYILNSSQKKIFLTQIAIDRINAGNSLDQISLTVTDGEASTLASATPEITSVNDHPFFKSLPIITATEDQLYSYPVVVDDNDVTDNLNISAVAVPSWLSFDQSTNKLLGTPTNADVGDHAVVIRVNDGTVDIEQSFSLTVTNTNDAPVLSGSPTTVVAEDATYNFQPSSFDDDNDNLTFSIMNKPIWSIFDEKTGGLTGTPNNSHVGAYASIVISVTDGIDTVDLDAFNLTVTNTNDAPVLNNIPNQTITENNQFMFTITSTDIDNSHNFTYRLISGPDDMTLDNITGVINWTPGDSIASGNIQVTIEVDDGSGADNSTSSGSFTLSVTATNDLPVGNVIISGIIAKGEVLSVSDNLTDADGLGPIHYQWQIDGTNIAGETKNTYQLSQADIAKSIQVIATFTDAQGNIETVVSNTSTQILNFSLNQLVINSFSNTKFDYFSAGISNVTDENITSINDAIFHMGVSSQYQVQQLVDSYNSILNYAANNLIDGNPPRHQDYSQIGVFSASENKGFLDLLNDVIYLGGRNDIDNLVELQLIFEAVLAVYDQSENTTNELSKVQLELLGVEAVTDVNLAAVRQIIADTDENIDKREKIQLLVNKVVASQIIQAYRDNIIDNPQPSLIHYQHLELSNINSENIQAINSAIITLDPIAIDSVEKIISTLAADSDSDEVIDIIDNFPLDPHETKDKDADNIGDNTDNCPNVANTEQLDLDGDTIGDSCDLDKDNDDVVNTSDNCPNVANTEQLDLDGDTIGDSCDQDEDNDGVISTEDAFKFNPKYSSDADGDGMADAYELEHGFDLNNSADKTTDSDGDGVSNLDEFLAGTDPRVNPNPGLPKLNIPTDIEVVSTGRKTAVDIGAASAIDGSNVVLQPVASLTGPFSAGRHEIMWSATDALGNQSKAVQVVKILPLINLTPSSLIAEGARVEVSAILSGDAADYPVRIPYEISGSAENTVDYQIDGAIGVISIEQGREASFSIEIKVDDELENDETIEVQIYQPTNAVLGSVTRRSISIIDGNLPPKISVIVEQGDNLGRVIAANKGAVTITAEVSDPNPEDSHNFDWQLESEQASAVVSETIEDHKKILVIDPSQLKPGVFSIAAKATDSADIVATTEVKTDFRLMEAAPDLSTEMDSDGDGVSDADEGYDDSDNDGIVDYMDNIVESNLAPISEDSNRLLQSPEGTQLVLGEMAFANAKNSVLVSREKVIQIISELQLQLSESVDDKDYIYPLGLYDFTISGAIPSQSYYLVIPLPTAIEEGQVFRKYMGSKIGWQNFIENANNTLFSAKAIDGACPEPASRLYDYGLQAGNNCMQIYIEDGGPNDADGKADGIVTDPAGIAIFNGSIEENTVTPAGAPSSELSSIKLSQSKLFVKDDTAIITIVALNNAGKHLDAVDIRVKCIFCLGVEVGQFTQTASGVYEAKITSGRQISFGYIEAELTNEFGSAKLEPQKLNVIYRPSGGCSIAANGRSDISLFLMLILLTLYHRRKKLLI